MLALRDVQAAFRDALLRGDERVAVAMIAGDGLSPAARLGVYRHHVFTSLTGALESTFPVVAQLVDRRFFAYAADRYIRAHPPADPRLYEYGATFADFLAAFEPCRHLAFLPDVARLEWAMNAALHADDAEPLDPGRLAAVAAADLPRVVVALDPSVSLLASAWPVDRIWRAHQDDREPDVDVSAGGVQLEIRRVDDGVTMRSLDAATYALRRALALGRTLEDAAAEAVTVQPAFDLAQAIRELLDERIAVDVAVSN